MFLFKIGRLPDALPSSIHSLQGPKVLNSLNIEIQDVTVKF